MHLIHWKLSYGTFELAKTHSDGLAVLSILFKADDNNHEYDPLEVGSFWDQIKPDKTP